MTTIMYGIREIETKKVIAREKKEQEAANLVGRLNKKANREKYEIVKVIITEEIFEM